MTTQVVVGMPEPGPGSAPSIAADKGARDAGTPTKLQQYSDGRRNAAGDGGPTSQTDSPRRVTVGQPEADQVKARKDQPQPTKAQSDKAAWEQKIADIRAKTEPNQPAPDGGGDGGPAEGMKMVEVDGTKLEVNQGDLTDAELLAQIDEMVLSEEDAADWQANVDAIVANVGQEAMAAGLQDAFLGMQDLTEAGEFNGMEGVAEKLGMSDREFGAAMAAAKVHQGRSVSSFAIAAGHNPNEVAQVLDANPQVRDAAFFKLAMGDASQLRSVIGSLRR